MITHMVGVISGFPGDFIFTYDLLPSRLDLLLVYYQLMINFKRQMYLQCQLTALFSSLGVYCFISDLLLGFLNDSLHISVSVY